MKRGFFLSLHFLCNPIFCCFLDVISINLIFQAQNPLEKQRPWVKDCKRPITSTKVSWPWAIVSATYAQINLIYPSATQLWLKYWEVNHSFLNFPCFCNTTVNAFCILSFFNEYFRIELSSITLRKIWNLVTQTL